MAVVVFAVVMSVVDGVVVVVEVVVAGVGGNCGITGGCPGISVSSISISTICGVRPGSGSSRGIGVGMGLLTAGSGCFR